MLQILYCPTCKNYTLQPMCKHCKTPTITHKPARFSPQDHYGRYRRELKKQVKNG